MAKKKEEAKVELERAYNIPLRKGFQLAPKYKRSKKAVNTLKIFIKRHMKSDNIKIGKFLNEKIWEHGIKNPPHHVQVVATKDSDGLVKVELANAPKTEISKQKEKKKGKEKKAEGKKEEEKEIKKEDKKTLDAKGPKTEVPKAEELAKEEEKK